MKSRCELADGHNADTLGPLIWVAFTLFYQSSISMTHRQDSEQVTSATPHAAGTNGGITTPGIVFLVKKKERDGVTEKQEGRMQGGTEG